MKYWKQSLYPNNFLASNNAGERVNFSVSNDDIYHHHSRFQELKRNGFPIPVTWEHQPSGVPQSLDDINARIADQARLFCGWCEDSRVTPDGQLEFLVDIPDEKDAKLVKNIGLVSPAFAQDFVDGNNTLYPGLSVTHLAVTPQPIQHRQRGFEPVHMSYGPNVLMLSLGNPMADDEYQDDEMEETGDMEEEVTEEADDAPADDTEPEFETEAEPDAVSECRNLLKDFGIDVAPTDTNDEFLEHLHTALLTAKAHKEGGMGEDTGMEEEEELYETEPEAGVEEEMPQNSVVMSLKNENLALRNHILNAEKAKIKTRLQKLKSACPNKQVVEELEKEFKGVRLSLGQSGKVMENTFLIKLRMAESFSKTKKVKGANELRKAVHMSIPNGAEEVTEEGEIKARVNEKPMHERVNQGVMQKLTGGAYKNRLEKLNGKK